MLVFTPEVNEVLRWFQATHQQQIGFGAAHWVRSMLPDRGAVGDQDARLMAALEYVRGVMNDVARDGKDDEAAKDELAAFRRKHGRNRR